MKKLLKNIFNGRILKLVLFMIVLLNISTPALAHNKLDGISLIIGIGIWGIGMIIAFIMLIIIITQISSFNATLSMAVINGVLFLIASSCCFGRRDYFSVLNLAFAAICLINFILAIYKNTKLVDYRHIFFGIITIYIILAAHSVYNFKYQTICLDAIKEGDINKVSFCIKKLGVNKRIKSEYNHGSADDYFGEPRPMTVIAAKARQPEIIRLLVSKGADYIDKEIISILSATGDINMVKKILDKNKTRQHYLNYHDARTYPVDMDRIDLSYAVRAKQYDMVKFLVSRGATNLETAIEAASAMHDKEILQFLLKSNSMLNNNSAIYHLALNGDITNLKQLMEQGADVNAKNEKGATAIAGAAKNGHNEIIRILIDAKADINNQDNRGRTALMQAAEHSQLEAVKLLLAAGADVNIKDKDGKTALVRITMEKTSLTKDDEEIIKLLLEQKADPNIICNLCETPLYQAVSLGNIEVVKSLLKYKADPNKFGRRNTNPCYKAIENGNVEILKLLLKYGADFGDGKSIQHLALLATAAKNNNLEIVEILLTKGVDVNTQEKYTEKTALHFAAENGNIEMVKKLIKNKADVNVIDNKGRIPLHYAAYEGYDEIVKIFLDHNAMINVKDHRKHTPLIRAVDGEHLSTVKILLEHGANPDITGVLITSQSTEMTNLLQSYPRLLQTQGSKSIEQYNNYQTGNIPPLFMAILSNEKNRVEYLIEIGVDVNGRDQSGYTPLMYAAMYNNVEIVKQLLAAKANINATMPIEDKKITALYIASVNNHNEIVSLLKAAGAKE